LCEFGTPEFYQTVRAVRGIAFDRAAALPPSIPLTMTNAYSDTSFGRENWSAIRSLADKRGSPLFIVALHCSVDENIRRLQAPERAHLRKLRDPAVLAAARKARLLLEDGGDHLLRLDVSEMEPAACADGIATWLTQHASI
jgi:hypothetical protein